MEITKGIIVSKQVPHCATGRYNAYCFVQLCAAFVSIRQVMYITIRPEHTRPSGLVIKIYLF